MALRIRTGLIVFGLAAAAILWPAPAFAQWGIITGTVRDAVTRAPVEIEVVICPEDSTSCTTTVQTDASGQYQVLAPAGTYYAHTKNDLSGRAYTNEVFGNILCPGACSAETARQSGAPLAVADDAEVHASFDLDRGGAIAGTVTRIGTGAPIVGVEVIAYAIVENEPRQFPTASTDAMGTYVVEGLPAGRYYLFTRSDPDAGYVNEIYDNVACGRYCDAPNLTAGTPIDVALGVTAGSRDFALDVGGHITGTVTDAVTALPIANVCVYAFTYAVGRLIEGGQDCVDAGGAYDIGGLATGRYILFAETFGPNYVQELYDGIHCPGGACDLGSAATVPVTQGATSADRHFTLDAGGSLRGTVRDAETSSSMLDGDVVVYRRDGNSAVVVGYSRVDYHSGAYVVDGLPGGTYYAVTDLSRYQNEIFDNLPCQATRCTPAEAASVGTPIVVIAGGDTTGIDFDLRNDIAPGPPYDPRALVMGSTVLVSWSPPFTGGLPTGYVLEAGAAPGATLVSLPTTSAALLANGVGPGRYFVRVRAVNAYGAGPASTEILVTVSAGLAPPTAPTGIVGWMSGPRLTLTWGAPSPVTPITGYVVEAGSASGLTDVATVAVNARSLTFIPVATGYYFVRVRAMNASGVGPASREVLVNSGLVPAPPGSPPNLSGSVTGATVTLRWTAPFGSTPSSYVVRAGAAPGLSNLAQVDTGSTATGVSFSSVPPGTYYVRVHAVNGLGLGPASQELTVVVR